MGQSRVVVLVGAILLVWNARAEAYMDPGSGSMLIQLLLGGVAGLAVAINVFWRRLLDRLGNGRGQEGDRSGRA